MSGNVQRREAEPTKREKRAQARRRALWKATAHAPLDATCIAEGGRRSHEQPAPRRRRLPRRDGLNVSWSQLLDFNEAIVLIPRAAPSAAEPDGVELEAWRAKAIPGGWGPTVKLKTLKRLPLLRPTHE